MKTSILTIIERSISLLLAVNPSLLKGQPHGFLLHLLLSQAKSAVSFIVCRSNFPIFRRQSISSFDVLGCDVHAILFPFFYLYRRPFLSYVHAEPFQSSFSYFVIHASPIFCNWCHYFFSLFEKHPESRVTSNFCFLRVIFLSFSMTKLGSIY
jgi:hypothetical protein